MAVMELVCMHEAFEKQNYLLHIGSEQADYQWKHPQVMLCGLILMIILTSMHQIYVGKVKTNRDYTAPLVLDAIDDILAALPQ
jgi:hypothetical protein